MSTYCVPSSVLIAKDREMNNTESLPSKTHSLLGRQKLKEQIQENRKVQPQGYTQNIVDELKRNTQPRQGGKGVSGKASWRTGHQSGVREDRWGLSRQGRGGHSGLWGQH